MKFTFKMIYGSFNFALVVAASFLRHHTILPPDFPLKALVLCLNI